MTAKHTRIDDDTLQPLCGIAYSDVAETMPYDWATGGITAKFEIETETGTSVLAATATGMTAHPTQTFTASTTTDLPWSAPIASAVYPTASALADCGG